jgi:peptidoglycan/LPS O-acetylase OafA/YrhL
MFGTFRFVLALMVVWYHLIDREMAGRVAVFGFYCLSGYLMTRVINTTYADGIGGFARYLTNRALRIYPTYLAVTALAMAAIAIWPTRYPAGMFDPAIVLANITILGIESRVTPLVIPTAWSLAVELIHYIAIGAVLGRSRLMTVLWFIVGVEMVIFGAMRNYPEQWFYFSPVGSTVAFATGAMIWHFRERLPRARAGIGFALIAAVLLLGVGMPREIGTSGGLYLGLLAAAACVTYLRDLPASARIDRWLGEFAYPLFLIHMPVDLIVRGIADADRVHTIVFTLPITFALAWITIVLIERPVERVRNGLRPKRARSTPQLRAHAEQP